MQEKVISEIREHIPEGHTIIFDGPQRSGKTLAGVIFALDAHNHNRPVFSNIQLGFPHTPLDFSDLELVDGRSPFWNGHVFIDELNFFFDARMSMSKEHRKFGTYLLQQKKQGVNVTGTTHDLMYLDKRLRQNHDFVIYPEVYPKYPNPNPPELLRLEIVNGPQQKPIHKVLKIPCKPFLNLYDTHAVYDPFKAKEAGQTDKANSDPPLPPPSRANLLG